MIQALHPRHQTLGGKALRLRKMFGFGALDAGVQGPSGGAD